MENSDILFKFFIKWLKDNDVYSIYMSNYQKRYPIDTLNHFKQEFFNFKSIVNKKGYLVHNLKNLINCGFPWRSSNESVEFWEGIHYKYLCFYHKNCEDINNLISMVIKCYE